MSGFCEWLRRKVAGGMAVARGLAEAADRAEAVLRALTEAEELAKFHSFLVTHNGQVTEPYPVVMPPDQAAAVAAERAAVKAEVIDRLEQLKRQATDVGADLAAVLNRAERGEIDDGTVPPSPRPPAPGRPSGGLGAAPAAGGRPGGQRRLLGPRCPAGSVRRSWLSIPSGWATSTASPLRCVMTRIARGSPASASGCRPRLPGWRGRWAAARSWATS